ncbi:unnamed protein product [Paramecium pentaurelia]|uniref:Uncharacterized protein n=1 Tax=Paramecium pentaurelia TaxID=43138 RepID=A0A8S1YPW9_9CILI|nr:unnamed protein product [Paramecium pentaurelia]
MNQCGHQVCQNTFMILSNQEMQKFELHNPRIRKQKSQKKVAFIYYQQQIQRKIAQSFQFKMLNHRIKSSKCYSKIVQLQHKQLQSQIFNSLFRSLQFNIQIVCNLNLLQTKNSLYLILQTQKAQAYYLREQLK